MSIRSVFASVLFALAVPIAPSAQQLAPRPWFTEPKPPRLLPQRAFVPETQRPTLEPSRVPTAGGAQKKPLCPMTILPADPSIDPAIARRPQSGVDFSVRTIAPACTPK